MYKINPACTPNLTQAVEILNLSNASKKLLPLKNFYHSYSENKCAELKSLLKKAKLEKVESMDNNGDCVYSLYIDDERQIIWQVLTFGDKAFVMKSVSDI